MWAAYATAGELKQMWLGKGAADSTQVLYCPACTPLASPSTCWIGCWTLCSGCVHGGYILGCSFVCRISYLTVVHVCFTAWQHFSGQDLGSNLTPVVVRWRTDHHQCFWCHSQSTLWRQQWPQQLDRSTYLHCLST